MKKIFLSVLLCSLAGASVGQIVLEHSYNDFTTRRTLIGGLGARYRTTQAILTPSDTNFVINWYTDDHQPDGQSVLPPSTGAYFFTYLDAQVDFFDDDPGIEVVYRENTSSGNRIRIADDDGGVLFHRALNGAPFPVLLRSTTGARKMLFRDTVYAIPGFAVEHVFPPNFDGVKIVNFRDGAKRYYYANDQGDITLVHADDYSVDGPYLSGLNASCPTAVYPFDYELLNDDPVLEWGVFDYCNQHPARVLSGQNILFDFEPQDAADYALGPILSPQNFPGLSDHKVLVYRNQNSTFSSSLLLFDLNTGQLEHSFDSWYWRWENAEVSGLKYYNYKSENNPASFSLLNPDYSLWKSIPKPAGVSSTLDVFSETLFDNTATMVEGLLTIAEPAGNYTIQVMREDGMLLFERPAGSFAVISRIPGTANKLVVYDIGNSNPAQDVVEVYSLPSSTPAVAVNEPAATRRRLSLSAAPNPASDQLRLDLSALRGAAATVTVFDMLGRTVYRNTLPATEATFRLETTGWAGGIYSILVQSRAGQGTCKALKW